ncbi:excisionase family DNA binding protein [Salinibacter ruber]|uniref:Excisionase family DNA binding protein n=3 Tax=Salinibacter ruber TaxID=146919 RepID=A0A9X2PTH5_9BACT|nr:excisionase family DNA binding protein [Salinibacter ruber]MCS3679521.1 excisionase family DNA binding protein [Salinibacter ruber]MCS4178472.1 excisionase family DNA binding protein [Salinibacter ruber]
MVEGLHEDLRALRDEVQSLHRKETMQEPEELLTREETANRLRISIRTLDDMADSGEIQPVRIRGRVLYHPETIEAYVQRRVGGDRR